MCTSRGNQGGVCVLCGIIKGLIFSRGDGLRTNLLLAGPCVLLPQSGASQPIPHDLDMGKRRRTAKKGLPAVCACQAIGTAQ